MNIIKKATLITTLLFILPSFANSSDSTFRNSVLFSKVAGNCDYLNRLYEFEVITNDTRNLSERLKKYEVTRLGQSISDWDSNCSKTESYFNDTVSSLKIMEGEDFETMYNIMLVSHTHGYCGMLKQSINFFERDTDSLLLLERFVSSESLRYGYESFDGLIEGCNKSSAYYDVIYEATGD